MWINIEMICRMRIAILFVICPGPTSVRQQFNKLLLENV